SYNDTDDITLTAVAGVNGVSTSDGVINITTVNGPILVANTPTANDVNAGASTVSLTAGSTGGTDFAVQLGAGANVTGTGGVTLTGDHLDFLAGATVNAGAAIA